MTGLDNDRRSHLAIALLVPIVGSALGINGGAIFQIVAVENLGLDSRQIGLAVGLGAVSIPFQIWAARIPLRLARRNLGIFVTVMALLCLAMAWLVIEPISMGFVVVSAIAIAVTAEIVLSVLFATSWQPLLSTTVSAQVRQRLNAQARAAASVLLIGIVTVVGWVGRDGRIIVLLAIAALGLSLLFAVARLRPPPDLDAAEEAPTTQLGLTDGGPESPSVVVLYVAIALSVVPAWPFFVTYAADVFWPTVNLGLVGAAFTLGGLVVGAAWRPTEARLHSRALHGSVVLLACGVALVPFGRQVSGGVGGVVVLGIVALAAGAGTAIRISLLELVHRQSNAANSVRVLTILDVVASTTMQVGFGVAGYLISFSATSTWPVDPYRLSLIAAPIALLVVVARLSSDVKVRA